LAEVIPIKQKPQEISGLDVALWAGILAGPIAWAFDEEASYALTQRACSTGHHAIFHVITIISLLIIAGGAISAWGVFVKLPPQSDEEGGHRVDRRRFMAIGGVFLCLMFAAIVIALAIPKWVLNPCD
jgi:hypothetical protein